MKEYISAIIRPLCLAASVAGFILVLGAAGASDLGTMPLARSVIQSLVGLALFGGGVVVRMQLCSDGKQFGNHLSNFDNHLSTEDGEEGAE